MLGIFAVRVVEISFTIQTHSTEQFLVIMSLTRQSTRKLPEVTNQTLENTFHGPIMNFKEALLRKKKSNADDTKASKVILLSDSVSIWLWLDV